MNKAFLGANGWYVAYERPDGFHYQSDGTMMRGEAENEARRRNDDQGQEPDDSEWTDG